MLALWSCGSVKQSSAETEIHSETEKNTEIDATKFSNNFSIEPVDLDRPILIGGKEFHNAKITNNYTKEIIKEKSNEVNKSDLKQDIDTKEKDYSEVIEKLANRFIWLIGILFVLYFILNYIKSKTPLIQRGFFIKSNSLYFFSNLLTLLFFCCLF